MPHRRPADPDATIQMARQLVPATYVSQNSSRPTRPRIRKVSAMVAVCAIMTAAGGAFAVLAIAVEVSTGRHVVSVEAVRVFVTTAAVGGVGIIVGVARDATLRAIAEARANHDRILAEARANHERLQAEHAELHRCISQRISDVEAGFARVAGGLVEMRAHLDDLLTLRDADIELHAMRKVSGEHWVITPRPGSGNGRLRPVD